MFWTETPLWGCGWMESSREAGSALAAYAAPEQHMQMEDEHPGLQDPFSANALLASYHALSDEQCRCASEHVPAAAFVCHAPRHVYQHSSGIAWGHVRAGVEQCIGTMNRSAWCT